MAVDHDDEPGCMGSAADKREWHGGEQYHGAGDSRSERQRWRPDGGDQRRWLLPAEGRHDAD